MNTHCPTYIINFSNKPNTMVTSSLNTINFRTENYNTVLYQIKQKIKKINIFETKLKTWLKAQSDNQFGNTVKTM